MPQEQRPPSWSPGEQREAKVTRQAIGRITSITQDTEERGSTGPVSWALSSVWEDRKLWK